MRHILMTCENHRDLRWSCKEVAVSENGRYNGSRNIFFRGEFRDGETREFFEDTGVVRECSCPGSALIAMEKLYERE